MSETATTLDRFLDGRLWLEQPARGRHRAGLDAVLLAALVPATAAGRLVDLGAGVGAAGLAVAVRAPGLRVVLAERDPEAARLARANAGRPENDVADRVEVIEIDLLRRGAARDAALPPESFDAVVVNPPYFAPSDVRASPHRARAAAHVFEAGALDDWLRVAASLLAPKGRLHLIFRGDGLAEIVAALAGRFGDARIRPVHPRERDAAHRLLVTATKGSRARASILPGLVLHRADSDLYLPEAAAILRGRADLAGDRFSAGTA
ncbi:MAG: methyltransferase [Hyphomicrobiales bacterium]|nr:methyltransferase [Hyphomicrobiales bacterium]